MNRAMRRKAGIQNPALEQRFIRIGFTGTVVFVRVCDQANLGEEILMTPKLALRTAWNIVHAAYRAWRNK